MAYTKIEDSKKKYFNKFNIQYDGLLIFLRMYNIKPILENLINNDIKSGNKQVVLFYDDFVNSYLNNMNVNGKFCKYKIDIKSVDISKKLFDSINIKDKYNTVYLLEPPFYFFYRKELKNIVNRLKKIGVNLIVLKDAYTSFGENFHYSLRYLFFNIDTVFLFRADCDNEFINFLNINPLIVSDIRPSCNQFHLFKNRELVSPYVLYSLSSYN